MSLKVLQQPLHLFERLLPLHSITRTHNQFGKQRMQEPEDACAGGGMQMRLAEGVVRIAGDALQVSLFGHRLNHGRGRMG